MPRWRSESAVLRYRVVSALVDVGVSATSGAGRFPPRPKPPPPPRPPAGNPCGTTTPAARNESAVLLYFAESALVDAGVRATSGGGSAGAPAPAPPRPPPPPPPPPPRAPR